MSDNHQNEKQEWRFYGRRAGRALNTARKEVMDKLYPLLCLGDAQITKAADLAPNTLFKTPKEKIILEIGFGNGERLAQHLQREPNTGFIGAEPFSNGMSSLLKDINDIHILPSSREPSPLSSRDLVAGSQPDQTDPANKSRDDVSADILALPDNIRVYMDDAIPLTKSLQSESIDQIMVLNPDPWHKARHHKRRIINHDNLEIFARILKNGGQLVMTTDVSDLIEWMVTQTTTFNGKHGTFEWNAQKADDWRSAPPNWIQTRYETKGAKGADKMHYLFFTKKA